MLKRVVPAGIAAVLLAGAAVPLLAQWPTYPTRGVPRTADGKPNLNAPVPKAADGKPDLSGVWETVPCSGCNPPDGQRASTAGVLPANAATIAAVISRFIESSQRGVFFCTLWQKSSTYREAKSIGLCRSSLRSIFGSGYFRPLAQLNNTTRSVRFTRPSARLCL